MHILYSFQDIYHRGEIPGDMYLYFILIYYICLIFEYNQHRMFSNCRKHLVISILRPVLYYLESSIPTPSSKMNLMPITILSNIFQEYTGLNAPYILDNFCMLGAPHYLSIISTFKIYIINMNKEIEVFRYSMKLTS
jgi:hypothetical protein